MVVLIGHIAKYAISLPVSYQMRLWHQTTLTRKASEFELFDVRVSLFKAQHFVEVLPDIPTTTMNNRKDVIRETYVYSCKHRWSTSRVCYCDYVNWIVVMDMCFFCLRSKRSIEEFYASMRFSCAYNYKDVLYKARTILPWISLAEVFKSQPRDSCNARYIIRNNSEVIPMLCVAVKELSLFFLLENFRTMQATLRSDIR